MGFLDHMLELFARHGDFDPTIRCRGTPRWTATTAWGHRHCPAGPLQRPWGQAGITRYGQFLLPMDETLVLVAATFPAGTIWAGPWTCPPKGGDFDTERQGVLPGLRPGVPHVLHIRQMAGEHPPILEAVSRARAGLRWLWPRRKTPMKFPARRVCCK
ncbi:MAG: hypothetical protein ACLTYN_05035 [Dysosmobacter welbionis]